MEIYAVDQPHYQILAPAVTLTTWQGNRLELAASSTHWGFVYQGRPDLHRQQGAQTFSLYPGMYFCLPGQGSIGGPETCGFVISCLEAEGMFSLGGPVEARGRFAYIDGGTNSLLVPPIRLGAPCLNALYFPPHRDQTMHTHPSYRVGLVLAGEGEGITPDRTIQLQPGLLFQIPAHQLHKFRTYESGMSFVVFHPDSDTGFTHRNNPMLNRTLVGGTSAAQIPEIQTAFESL